MPESFVDQQIYFHSKKHRAKATYKYSLKFLLKTIRRLNNEYGK